MGSPLAHRYSATVKFTCNIDAFGETFSGFHLGSVSTECPSLRIVTKIIFIPVGREWLKIFNITQEVYQKGTQKDTKQCLAAFYTHFYYV